MSECESFFYKGECYSIRHLFSDHLGNTYIRVYDSYGSHRSYYRDTRELHGWDAGNFPSELDSMLRIYAQHGGFAGMTAIEYLDSLGLIVRGNMCLI